MSISNDTSKRLLVEKLIKESKITLDEGLQLLADGEFRFFTPYVQPLYTTPINYPITYPTPSVPFTHIIDFGQYRIDGLPMITC